MQVGDVVKVKPWSEAKKIDAFTPGMKAYCGKQYKIIKASPKHWYRLDGTENFIFTKSMLTLVKSEPDSSEGLVWALLPPEKQKELLGKPMDMFTGSKWEFIDTPPAFEPDRAYRLAKITQLAYKPYTCGPGHVGQTVKCKVTGEYHMITASLKEGVRLSYTPITYEELLEGFEHLNGAPCGVKA